MTDSYARGATRPALIEQTIGDCFDAIAEAPDEPGTSAFATQANEVRKRARELSVATKLDQAVRREAQLVAACAGCHDAANVVPDVGTPPAEPREGSTVESRMDRHRWAADRLWDGVMTNDDGAWKAGLDVLATPSSVWSQMSPKRSYRKLSRCRDRHHCAIIEPPRLTMPVTRFAVSGTCARRTPAWIVK